MGGSAPITVSLSNIHINLFYKTLFAVLLSLSLLSKNECLARVCYDCPTIPPPQRETACTNIDPENICAEHQACGNDHCNTYYCITQCYRCSCPHRTTCRRDGLVDDSTDRHYRTSIGFSFDVAFSQKRRCRPISNLGEQP